MNFKRNAEMEKVYGNLMNTGEELINLAVHDFIDECGTFTDVLVRLRKAVSDFEGLQGCDNCKECPEFMKCKGQHDPTLN